eukprot:329107-Chlamydomonas_euryale.AAC.23
MGLVRCCMCTKVALPRQPCRAKPPVSITHVSLVQRKGSNLGEGLAQPVVWHVASPLTEVAASSNMPRADSGGHALQLDVRSTLRSPELLPLHCPYVERGSVLCVMWHVVVWHVGRAFWASGQCQGVHAFAAALVTLHAEQYTFICKRARALNILHPYHLGKCSGSNKSTRCLVVKPMFLQLAVQCTIAGAAKNVTAPRGSGFRP